MKLDTLIAKGELIISGTFQNRTTEFDLLQELGFSIDTLNISLEEHGRKAAVIEEMFTNKQAEVEKAGLRLKKDKAHKWKYLKESATDINDKQLSDKRVDIMVEADDELYQSELKYLELVNELTRLKNALSRMKERKDLLQTYASNVRNSQ